MGKISYVLVFVASFVVVVIALSDRPTDGTKPVSNLVNSEERSLRLDAICKLGWVAGNSENHPIWPEVRPYVGIDGEYYTTFVHLRARGEDAEEAANLNVQTYERCRNDGAKQPFSEAENMNRIRRVLQISEELRNMW